MKYKHGFLALLSTCVLTAASVAHADTGGASGAAGSTAGGAGSTAAGAGGASAGAAGTGTAGTGTAGKGGTSAAGTGGTSAAGTGGTGNGVAGSPGAAVTDIGKKCAADADCGGGKGKCLTVKGTEFNDGGPVNGYCTVDCTDWLVALDKAQQGKAGSAGAPLAPLPYPCQPDADINNPADNDKFAHLCSNFGDETTIKGYCVELCDFGSPKLAAGSKLSADKCHGRPEVGCFPSADSETGVLNFGICEPICSTDSQCGAGSYCDVLAGVCKAGTKAKKLKNGSGCTVPTDANAASPCEGICVRLFASDDPKVPADKKNAGLCIDPCVLAGGTTQCGGQSVGICGFGIFRAFESNGKTEIAGGVGDFGGCLKTSTTSDAGCDYKNGILASDISQGQGIDGCFPRTECESDDDCDPDTVGGTCEPVALLDCKKFCIDHDADPDQKCGGTAGTGGKGGTGGAGPSAGGATGNPGGSGPSTGGKAGKGGSTTVPVGQGGSSAGSTQVQPAASSDDGGCSVPVTGGSTGSSSALLAGLGLLGALVSRRRRQG